MPTATTVAKKGRSKGKTKKKSTQTKIDEAAVKQLLEFWQVEYDMALMMLEKQQKNRSFNGNLISGSASAGTTMEQYGLLRGICVGLNIPYFEVNPSQWVAAYPEIEIPDDIQQLKLEDTKKRSLALARLYFPDQSLLKNSRCRVPSDAYSDALLIGNYYFQKLSGLDLAA